MILINIIFILININLSGQNPPYKCGDLMTTGHDVYMEPTISDFVKKELISSGNSSDLISDRNQLIPFTTWYVTDSNIILIDKEKQNIAVEIKIGKHKLQKKEKANAFGLIVSDTSTNLVEWIQEFNVFINEKKIVIPEQEYNKLFYPNIYAVNLPIIPPNAYKSLDGKYLFIYLYGKHRGKDIYDWSGYTNSYIAKFIFEIEKGYLTKIVIPGSFLNNYGWSSCPQVLLKI